MEKNKDLEKLIDYIKEMNPQEVEKVKDFVSTLKTQHTQESYSHHLEKVQ